MLEHLDHCWMCVKLLADAVREKGGVAVRLTPFVTLAVDA